MQDQETCKGRLLREEEAQQDNKGSEQTRIKNSPERLSHQKPVTFIVFQNADEKNVICGETPKSAETELLEDNRVKSSKFQILQIFILFKFFLILFI